MVNLALEALVLIRGLASFAFLSVMHYIVAPVVMSLPPKLLPSNFLTTMKKISTLNVSYHTLTQQIREVRILVYKSIKVGKEAPGIDVVTLDGDSKSLFDYKRDGRMLVISFGSNT